MTEKQTEAQDKLTRERKLTGAGQHEKAVADAVAEALAEFCRQSEELAQAVAEGGSFEECCKAVCRGAGSCLSDIEAYRRAVAFYLPGASVEFAMRVTVPGEKKADTEREAPKTKKIELSLADFL